MSDDDCLSAETMRLEDARGEPQPKAKAKAKGKAKAKAKAASDTKKKSGLREMQWAVIHEEQKKIKKANPEMSAKDVLKAAREAYFDGN